MKKALVLSFVALIVFGAVAFGNGPLLGVSTVPTSGAIGVLTMGWDFGPVNLEAWKLDMTTPFGLWALGVIWTPDIVGFGYRAGVELILDYIQAPGIPANGILQYDSFAFNVGVSRTWGPIQIYGDLELMPVGVLAVTPVIGFNLLFGNLIPAATL